MCSVRQEVTELLIRSRQSGFSLIELMVALIIGLVIILGAGQLFLTGVVSFRQVQLLGDKQSALIFASETLVRDIRRAKSIIDDSGTLEVEVANREDVAACDPEGNVVKRYWVEADGGENVLKVSLECPALAGPVEEPLVSGFAANGFTFLQNPAVAAEWVLTFDLLSSADNAGAIDSYTFRAVNRTLAVESIN